MGPLRLTHPTFILKFLNIKLGCLWQRLLSSPLERGAGGVLRQTYTPLYPLFLEGNHKRLKFLYIKLGWVLKDKTQRLLNNVMIW